MITTVSAGINLSALRISQDFLEQGGGAEKIITTIPVRKPERQVLVRVHPDPAFKFQTFLLEVKEDNSTYLVDRSIWEHVSDLVGSRSLKCLI
jgi:hypothetical protein